MKVPPPGGVIGDPFLTATVLAAVLLPALVVVYSFGLYPLFLKIVAAFRRPPGSRASEAPELPSISISLPVYNEEATIRATLDRLLESDYPADRLQIVVVSDASTDRTDDIVREYADLGVELFRQPQRKGKTAAENAIRPHLRGDIIVNTDASILIHPQALRALAAVFADRTVGVASGRDVSVAAHDERANMGESRYVGYEMWVRDLETRAGGIVGASGCLYASRRELHNAAVPDALSRDFAAPLIAKEKGYRSVSVSGALCFVPRTRTLRQEYRRKVRTMTRGLETLYFKRRLLNPFKHGLFAWMLMSHKLARWLVPWAALLGVIGVALLSRQETWARWTAGAAMLFGAMGLVGWIWPTGRAVPRFLAVPGYVVSSVVAGLHAWIRALRGELSATWEPTRRDPTTTGV